MALVIILHSCFMLRMIFVCTVANLPFGVWLLALSVFQLLRTATQRSVAVSLSGLEASTVVSGKGAGPFRDLGAGKIVGLFDLTLNSKIIVSFIFPILNLKLTLARRLLGIRLFKFFQIKLLFRRRITLSLHNLRYLTKALFWAGLVLLLCFAMHCCWGGSVLQKFNLLNRLIIAFALRMLCLVLINFNAMAYSVLVWFRLVMSST